MSKVSTVQRKLSLPVISSCPECHWFEPCGGYRDQNGLFGNTCFDRHCCGGRQGCNYLCPSNPRFATMMNEVEGLQFGLLPELAQRRVSLPGYVPSILHHSCREGPLDIPFAAIPAREILHVCGGHMRAVAGSADELRSRLGLGAETRIVMNCVRPDDEIERLWEYWVQDDVPALLRPLRIDAVIAPNFSHFRGVPRLEILGNRMRHLMCVRDLADAGLRAVPHLSVVDPQDWDFWREWLARNPKVRYAAFECETGCKNAVEGRDAIGRLACIQRDLKRDLHLIVVGGTQYRSEVRALFPAHTLIDATPFSKAMRRQRARLGAGQLAWSKWETASEEPLDELLTHNLSVYGNWIAERGNRRSCA